MDILQASIDSYEREKSRVSIQTAKYKKYISEIEADLNDAISSGAGDFIVNEYKRVLQQERYEAKSFMEQVSFLRRPIQKDIDYRLKQREQYHQRLANVLSHDEMLCFHGTTLIAAKNILVSGEISSGADRFGKSTSFDPPGKISVTNKDTAETSIGMYMRLNDNYCYPAGCLFVVSAKDKEEYDNLSSGWMIKNVNFRENPDRLVAVITTPENLERVSGWARDGKVDEAKVMDFDKFINNYQQQKSRETKYDIQQTMRGRGKRGLL